jgi:predicted RNA-binding protein with PUA-like domain
MPNTFQPTIEDQTYNGWSNYETWNVALYIQNDESLYHFAKDCNSYDEVIAGLWECGSKETPDGVKWNSKKINRIELNEMLQDLSS